jgi:hypothetical protein
VTWDLTPLHGQPVLKMPRRVTRRPDDPEPPARLGTAGLTGIWRSSILCYRTEVSCRICRRINEGKQGWTGWRELGRPAKGDLSKEAGRNGGGI